MGADHKRPANVGCVDVIISAKVFWKKTIKPANAVPFAGFEVIEDWMI